MPEISSPVSHSAMAPPDCSPPGSSQPWSSLGRNTSVGWHFLFQRIFPTWTRSWMQRWILNHLSHQGSPTRRCKRGNSKCASVIEVTSFHQRREFELIHIQRKRGRNGFCMELITWIMMEWYEWDKAGDHRWVYKLGLFLSNLSPCRLAFLNQRQFLSSRRTFGNVWKQQRCC